MKHWRRPGEDWISALAEGSDAVLRLDGFDIALPLPALSEGILPQRSPLAARRRSGKTPRHRSARRRGFHDGNTAAA